MTNKVYESIKEHEGFSSTAYKCSQGKITIGFGRNLEDNGITSDEADSLLLNDIQRVVIDLQTYLENFRFLPDNVQDVLIEMAYQLGMNGLIKFKKTLEHIKNEDYKSASIEMLNSKWAKQTPNRAKTLSNLMKGGN